MLRRSRLSFCWRLGKGSGALFPDQEAGAYQSVVCPVLVRVMPGTGAAGLGAEDGTGLTGDGAGCFTAMAGSAESGVGTVRGSGLIIVRAGEGSERETGGGSRLLCAGGAADGAARSAAGGEAVGGA